jgi:hypothetical protein
MSEDSRFCFGPTGITEVFIAVLGPSGHVLGRDFHHTSLAMFSRPAISAAVIGCWRFLGCLTRSLSGAELWDVWESETRMDMKSIASVLRHVDPSLGNDREINNYTKPLVINGSANNKISASTGGYNNNGKNFLRDPWLDVISRTS